MTADVQPFWLQQFLCRAPAHPCFVYPKDGFINRRLLAPCAASPISGLVTILDKRLSCAFEKARHGLAKRLRPRQHGGACPILCRLPNVLPAVFQHSEKLVRLFRRCCSRFALFLPYRVLHDLSA